MSRSIRTSALGAVLMAITTCAVNTQADSVIFSEGDFDPGTWSLGTPFWGYVPEGGVSMSVTTDRFIGGNPENKFMAQFFTVNFPLDTFNVAFAPVMMNNFVYDPSTQGAITEIGASMLTMQIAENQIAHNAAPRIYIEQNGRIFLSHNSGTWNPFSFDDPATLRSFSGFTENNFFEIVPNVGINFGSTPDFAGSTMRFGFGLSLGSHDLNGLGPVLLAGGFDDVSVRLETIPVPAPGAFALLGLAGLSGLGRGRSR